VDIKCTNCGAVLKTPTPIAPDKKVKCPKCNETFTVQVEDAPPPEEPKPAPAADGGDDEGAPKKDKGGNGEKSYKNLILIIVAAVTLFCCCPTICFHVYLYAWGRSAWR
jgi:hypothetical protein